MKGYLPVVTSLDRENSVVYILRFSGSKDRKCIDIQWSGVPTPGRQDEQVTMKNRHEQELIGAYAKSTTVRTTR
jgi:hypothetical protein